MSHRIPCFCLLLVACFISTTNQRQPDDTYLIKQFHEAKIVPVVIPEAPTQRCHVIYKNHGVLYPGEKLVSKASTGRPNVTWDDADPNSLYTIYMAAMTNWTFYVTPLDPALNISKEIIKHEFHQWVRINIPGTDVEKGQDLYWYQNPGTPMFDYVYDAYAFLIYKQAYRIIPPKPRWVEWYMFQEFSPTMKFVKQYNLTGPIAGNIFYSVL